MGCPVKNRIAFLFGLAALATTSWLAPGALAASDTPQYGKWGFDTAGEDRATKPGDDFFRYANGAWLDRHQIPADKPAVSLRLEMTDRVEGRVHDMIEKAAASVPHQPTDLEGKAGAFYKAFMDEDTIEKLGAKPIEAELADVRAAKSRDALTALMGRTNTGF